MGNAIQAIVDFLVDDVCHACGRHVEVAASLSRPSSPPAIALDTPLRIGLARVCIETQPLCRACCGELRSFDRPITIGAPHDDGSIELLSHERIRPVNGFARVRSPLLLWPAFETDQRLLAVMHALKFSQRERLAPWLAGALVEGLPSRAFVSVDDAVVVPVPMDRASVRRRGFNQAERIARAFARRMGVQVVTNAIVKTRATAPQSSLGGLDRVRNVANAFGVGAPGVVTNRCVVLVDDLVTTGATAAASTLALWEAGASEVRVVCAGYRP